MRDAILDWIVFWYVAGLAMIPLGIAAVWIIAGRYLCREYFADKPRPWKIGFIAIWPFWLAYRYFRGDSHE